MYRRLKNYVDIIRERTDLVPGAAIVLGSGLGAYGERIRVEAEIPYSRLEGFPVSTVAGHQGRFLFGTVRGVPVVLMQGRVHYYEGYDMQEVVLPVRLMRMLGAHTLLLTNAAGGINLSYEPGDLMMLTDHISSFVPSPLRGANMEELGPRFPDMSQVYDRGLMEKLRGAAQREGIVLREGVYAQMSGPNYETPAEIRMLRTLGADAVGMSTVCEAMAARHMGMRVCGISCITNMAAGILDRPLDHQEVQETADRVKDHFERLVTSFVSSLA